MSLVKGKVKEKELKISEKTRGIESSGRKKERKKKVCDRGRKREGERREIKKGEEGRKERGLDKIMQGREQGEVTDGRRKKVEKKTKEGGRIMEE